MLFLWFVDTAGKVNMYGESGGWGSTNLWRGLRELGGILLRKRFRSGSEQGRDVVLQPVDVWPAGPDRSLLEGLLQDGGEIKETG